MKQKFSIRGRSVRDKLCYIIGEVGVNHNGDAVIAHALLKKQGHGVDAVKFQMFDESFSLQVCKKAEYQLRETTWFTTRYAREVILTMDEFGDLVLIVMKRLTLYASVLTPGAL